MTSTEDNQQSGPQSCPQTGPLNPPSDPHLLALVAEIGDIRGEIAEQRAWAEGHDLRCDDRGAMIQAALDDLKRGQERLLGQVRALQGRSDRADGAANAWGEIRHVVWRAVWGTLRVATGAGLALAGGHLVLGWQ
jgi:hypothetical protein